MLYDDFLADPEVTNKNSPAALGRWVLKGGGGGGGGGNEMVKIAANCFSMIRKYKQTRRRG